MAQLVVFICLFYFSVYSLWARARMAGFVHTLWCTMYKFEEMI